jgi:hypothetical protein
MRLLIEKYYYNPSVLNDLGIPDDWRQTIADGTQTIDKVGYYRADFEKESIFILPKIFEFNKIAFGHIKVEELAILPTPEVFKKHPESHRYLEWLYRFSLSLYLSLREYRRRNPETVLSRKTHFRNIIAHTPDDETSELELVLSLLEFYRNNHDLIVFTEKQLESQHFRKTNWAKTIRTQQPFFTENNEPIYLKTIEKQRHKNNEEELFIILYSVLNHLKKQYGFRIDIQTSLALIDKIDTPSVSAKLIRRLKELKNVYFSDRFRKLLTLLLLYFQRKSEAKTQQGGKEYLLCHDYHLVFEDMIDVLLSDEEMDRKLKNQSDGKIVDHLFSHESLFAPDDSIWYIGDSKYYKEKTQMSVNAIWKQHTYAKNIIQYNLNLFNNGETPKERYRDELTEGYNVTPNFFIQAFVHHDDLFKADAEFDFDNKNKDALFNYHFENRLFDRDTLSIHNFKINFLFVLRSYITRDFAQRSVFRMTAIQTIKQNVLVFYNNKYEFYKVLFDDVNQLEDFVKRHFKYLNGKIYQTSLKDNILWLALDKKYDSNSIKSLFVDGKGQNMLPSSIDLQ